MKAQADSFSITSQKGKRARKCFFSHHFYKEANLIQDNSQHLAEPEFKRKFLVDLKPQISQLCDAYFLQLMQS